MRQYQHLLLDVAMCRGLRESVRPLTDGTSIAGGTIREFCERLYLAYYELERDPDLAAIDFAIDLDDVLLINHFVSAEDGDSAEALLAQTRMVLYEFKAKKPAVSLASSKDAALLFEFEADPSKEPEPPKDLPEKLEDATLVEEE